MFASPRLCCTLSGPVALQLDLAKPPCAARAAAIATAHPELAYQRWQHVTVPHSAAAATGSSAVYSA